MAPEQIDDGPESSGCDIDLAQHADDELTASLRPLFPDGVPHDQWHELWKNARP